MTHKLDSTEVVRSLSFDQKDILKWIIKLYCPDGIDCDMTYGKGGFWKELPTPQLKFDIDPQFQFVTKASSVSLPLAKESLQSAVFDPPFLTYVRAGRSGNGSMIMSNAFSGYWKYEELKDHYIGTLKEATRVLVMKGVLIFKCQDIIHNHSMHCTHANVINWAAEEGFALEDLFVLAAKSRLPAPNRVGTQKHARIFHSYFLVLRKRGSNAQTR